MRLVVDASVATKWLVDEGRSDMARKLLEGNDEIHAPRLMASEVANALWNKTRRGEITRNEAGALLLAMPEMPVLWSADETICADALRLALALEHPAYDCMYLALAHRIGATVVTEDGRFADRLEPTEHGRLVVTLADYAAARY